MAAVAWVVGAVVLVLWEEEVEDTVGFLGVVSFSPTLLYWLAAGVDPLLTLAAKVAVHVVEMHLPTVFVGRVPLVVARIKVVLPLFQTLESSRPPAALQALSSVVVMVAAEVCSGVVVVAAAAGSAAAVVVPMMVGIPAITGVMVLRGLVAAVELVTLHHSSPRE